METQGEISEQKNDKELFDKFIRLVQKRQRLEDIYYSTGDCKILVEIDRARERIRIVLRGMGVMITHLL